MQQLSDFSLRRYLHADLQRAYLLQDLAVRDGSLRFWLGAFSPRMIPVLLCRLAYKFSCINLSIFAKFISFINFVFFGIEIAVRCPIGKGLFFPHTQGTVIGAWSIGENATIYQGVTLGAKDVNFSYLETSRPKIGDDVVLGSGVKVLGGLSIGSGCRVGANAVVVSDLPDHVVAIGIPAHVIKTLSEPLAL